MQAWKKYCISDMRTCDFVFVFLSKQFKTFIWWSISDMRTWDYIVMKIYSKFQGSNVLRTWGHEIYFLLKPVQILNTAVYSGHEDMRLIFCLNHFPSSINQCASDKRTREIFSGKTSSNHNIIVYFGHEDMQFYFC